MLPEMMRYLAASRQPYVFVAADVPKSPIHCPNTVRKAGQVWVNCNMHYPASYCAFSVKDVELAAYHVLKVGGANVESFESLLVIDVIAVGKRDKPLLSRSSHEVRLIIVRTPVSYIFAARSRQVI
jgi:hypothetical protein